MRCNFVKTWETKIHNNIKEMASNKRKINNEIYFFAGIHKKVNAFIFYFIFFWLVKMCLETKGKKRLRICCGNMNEKRRQLHLECHVIVKHVTISWYSWKSG